MQWFMNEVKYIENKNFFLNDYDLQKIYLYLHHH